MGFMQSIKNYIGDHSSYMRCPVSGDTLWYSNITKIPYSEKNGVLVTLDSLRDFSREEVAERIFDSVNNLRKGTTRIGRGRMYSIEEIVEKIPDIRFWNRN
ncbi:hypothetical protein HOE04_04430 [archaeon]|jgi:hypothetical protein|nr:hypothetical protein [archaeon]